MKKTTRVLREILNGDSQQIAYNLGKSRQWVERQKDENFVNILDQIERWSRALAKTDWKKIDLLQTWFDELVRDLRQEVVGDFEHLPELQEHQLLMIKHQLENLLAN